jgi:CRISP-associated protein Cas1
LDPAVGYLHRDRPGRPSLALDLVEEFRPVIADRLAASLIDRRQIRATGFRQTESGAVEMDDVTRKEVLGDAFSAAFAWRTGRLLEFPVEMKR